MAGPLGGGRVGRGVNKAVVEGQWRQRGSCRGAMAIAAERCAAKAHA